MAEKQMNNDGSWDILHEAASPAATEQAEKQADIAARWPGSVKKKKQRKFFNVPALVIGLLLAILVSSILSASLEKNRQETAVAYGKSKLNSLYRSLNTCTAMTEAMADVVIIDKGEVKDFDTLADAVYSNNDMIRCVQLAPGGVVSYIYPLEGNEASLNVDLFSDPDRREEALKARNSGIPMVAGPFELKQGGFGMAIREPVYLTKGKMGTFWGFSIVIADMDMVLKKANFDSSIKTMGYRYRLTAIVDGQEVFVSGEKEGGGFRTVTVEQTIYGKTWRLYLNSHTTSLDRFLFWGAAVMMFAIAFLFSALVQQNINLRNINYTDALTGVRNRLGFDKAMAAMAADRRVKSACIVAMDINNFKSFNDLYGHAVGDILLTSFAEELSDLVGRAGVISRNGGDEFQMLFKNPADDWKEKFRDFFNRKHFFEAAGREYFYYASAGIAVYPKDSRDFTELYRRADAALYHAKSKVHHHVSRFRPEMDDEPREQMGFNFKDLAGGAPGAVLIYKDDDIEEILYANNECLRLFECDTLQEFMWLTGRSFRTLVHPDDILWAEGSIARQQADPASDGYDYLSYRIRTKNDVVKTVFDAGRRIHHEYYGDIYYVLLFDLSTLKRADSRKG